MSERHSRRTAAAGVALSLGSALLILVLTLQAADNRHHIGVSGLCVLCGEFGLANILRNILLFVPLGIGLGLAIRSPLWAWLPALALTTFVELVQFFVPGRNPLLIDVVANAGGAAAGIAFIRLTLWNGVPSLGHRLLQGALVAVPFLVLGGTATAFQLAPPPGPHFVQMTPDLYHTRAYPGEVEETRLGDTPLSAGRHPAPEELTTQLFGGERLAVTVRLAKGSPTRGALLSIRNQARQEMFYMGIHGDDLTVRLPYRAAELRLDGPMVRLHDAVADLHGRMHSQDQGAEKATTEGTGDPSPPRVDLGYLLVPPNLEPEARICLVADGMKSCALRPTLGRGWGLLLYPEELGRVLHRALDVFWLFGLGLLPGLILRSRGSAIAGGVVLTLFAFFGPAFLQSMIVTPATEALTVACGVLVGRLVRTAPRSLRARNTSSPDRR